MIDLIFIGTLHAGLTPHHELVSVLEHYAPEQLLVEIVDADLRKNNLKSYPDEMIAAVMWAKEQSVPVFGFDAPIQTFATGKTEADNSKVIEEQKQLLGSHTWKDVNRSKVNALLNTSSAEELDVPEKVKERETAMLQHIQQIYTPGKRTIVLTGTGHLDFFAQQFPEAQFPLR